MWSLKVYCYSHLSSASDNTYTGTMKKYKKYRKNDRITCRARQTCAKFRNCIRFICPKSQNALLKKHKTKQMNDGENHV